MRRALWATAAVGVVAAMKSFGTVPAAGAPAGAPTREHIWIIGGGPNPDASQAQIEFNVKWLIQSLRVLLPDAVLKVFYGDGTARGKATVEWRSPDAGTRLEAFARVFGEITVDGNTYRAHRVAGVVGSTRADSLIPELERQFAELHKGDRALIVYSGHGSWDADHWKNALRLWGDTHLTVRDFERLLSRVDTAVPVRFVLPQCFGGAFERAVHPGGADIRTLAPGTRCGFFAVSAEEEAEGCSASLRIGDYRDYTSYFFSALTGRTQQGEPMPGNPDLDGDGKVSPFEAHLYVLANGYSTDVPRSTSEVYLERWQPWFVRWLESRSLPTNVYGTIARQLARRIGLPENGLAMGRALQRRHEELDGRMAGLDEQRQHLEDGIAAIQQRIQRSLAERWPEALHPYTAGFKDFLDRDLAAAQSNIVRHPEYAGLVTKQRRLADIEIAVLEVQRQVAQLEKLRRVRMLARALQEFERLASTRDQSAYQRLRSCEELPL